jgi:hypothetical protein
MVAANFEAGAEIPPPWLRPKRGLLVYGTSLRDGVGVVHLSRDVEIGTITKTSARDGIQACGWLDLKQLLDRIDLKANRKSEKSGITADR